MLQNREKLELLLNIIIQKYNNDKEKADKIVDIMTQHGISPGEASKLTEGQILLQSIQNKNILYIYTDALYRATDDNRIKPEDWFTELEIQDGEQYTVPEEDKIDEIVLHNVVLNGNRHLVCLQVSGAEFLKWMRQRLLTYNTQTQRPTVKSIIFDEFTESPDIRPHKVNQITKAIVNNEYTTDDITLNIRKTGFEKIDYDDKTLTLRIPICKENYIDIVDGCHRIMGSNKALTIKPDLEIYWTLHILNYDIKEARRFVDQKSKATPIKREGKSLYDMSNTNMIIAQDIASFENSTTNVMYNKIGEDVRETQYRDKYTTYDAAAKAIAYNFRYHKNEARDIQKVKENIVRGLNEILGYLKDTQGNLEKKKDKYVYLESNMFIGYIALLSTVWNSKTKTFIKDWDITVQTVLDSIDFSRNNELWKNLSLYNNEKLNSITIKDISEYFKGKGDELNETQERA